MIFFFQELGSDKSIISRFSHSSNGFIMIPCMSDLVEWEIQRLGASPILF